MGDDLDDFPELATNEDWRGIMKRARLDHKVDDHAMTQTELAVAVGKLVRGVLDEPSQAMISKIESGAASSSRYVIPICKVLSIPLPDHFSNEDDRDWVRLGRVLRAKAPDEYMQWVKLLESIAKRVAPEPPDDDADEPTKKERSREQRK